MKFNTNFQV